MTYADDLARTVAFLRTIGLEVLEAPNAKGFLEDIRIEKGCLLFQPTASPSNLLHEAGHIAVMPAKYRSYATDNMDAAFERMGDEISSAVEAGELDPCGPEIRAVMQAGECEATAWAFAAGRAIGLPDEVTIRDVDYDGEGEEVRTGLIFNAYFGINGLVAGGMCENVRAYPTLTRWLQH